MYNHYNIKRIILCTYEFWVAAVMIEAVSKIVLVLIAIYCLFASSTGVAGCATIRTVVFVSLRSSKSLLKRNATARTAYASDMAHPVSITKQFL